ncbi:carboxypeptidase regulatory-like domain-containing protein [Actinacidiphila sp. bgisy144]|uniref:carboxypeptidase regulatory-like domain-containing protein n=1 Tax=Actinacidiphila sp. bgisy144 TaxID=3413791 RepID=UPI003EB944A1
MFRRGRTRAPVPLFIAAVALCTLAAGQGTGAAATPSPATAVTTTAAATSTTGPEVPRALADDLPQYTPAGCAAADADSGQPVATCDALIRTGTSHTVRADAAGPPSTALTPADIQQAYRLPADAGQGQTVAVVDAGGYAAAESDLAAFRAQYGLPACGSSDGCFRKVDQRGGTGYPADDAGWALETALDLDAVSSACPQCHILLVEGDSADIGDLGAAADTAVRLGAKFVSNSYGLSGENSIETSYSAYYDHPGVVVTASTGDKGNIVNWPASDPDVVAVGGTTLTADAGSDRGWRESAWSEGGSGCSLYEPQPAYQSGLATGCARRATADIAADADPQTGLGVYDTLGQDGWLQVGGTSLSAPLMAAMYALAGTPADSTYPVTYPYTDQGNHLFDVTAGTDGSCGTVLCTAGAGWDGPTGLGTPDGVSALAQQPGGTVAGHLTDASGGAGLPGAVVTFTAADGTLTYRATADSSGAYTLTLPAGTYTAAATDFGYDTASASGVTVSVGGSATTDLALTKQPTRTVSGTVTDGSGHGYPLYAKITIDGYPSGVLHTDPQTGRYSVELPRNAAYTLHVASVYPGYEQSDGTVTVGTSDVRHDVRLSADQAGCAAPGYAYPAAADFEGWSTAPRSGWTVTGGSTGDTWQFDSSMWNLTGGSGNFATADPYDHAGAAEDTTLTTPAMDLSGQTDPALHFDTAYLGTSDTAADVGLSTDGGKTWTSVWHQTTGDMISSVSLPLTAAYGRGDVELRFHFTGQGTTLWQVDDVTVGSCATVPGGIVTGTVTDANTGKAVDGAVVTDTADPEVTTATAATPDDPALPDGWYWLFAQGAGRHTYTAAANRYTTATKAVATTRDTVTTTHTALSAGRLAVTPGKVTASAALGKQDRQKVTLTNTGGAPITVTVGEQSGSYTAGTGASSGSWQQLPALPQPVMDNAEASYQGRAYSVGGIRQIVGGTALAEAYVYDPVAAAWQRIADLPEPLAGASAAFLDGTLYVVGGWTGDANAGTVQIRSAVYAYHPAADTWTTVASLPAPEETAATAVLDGGLYVVGGCFQGCGPLRSDVYRYTPATDTWTAVADYPSTVQREACAGITGEVVCAGGASQDSAGHTQALATAYAYNPRSDSWTRLPDLPYPVWGMASSGANGELQVAGGYTASGSTDRAIQFDPVTDRWTDLPDTPLALLRGGGSGCGMYQVGGDYANGLSFGVGTTDADVLPGFDQCGGDDVGWLTEQHTTLTIKPGHSSVLQVTADAADVPAAGRYTAGLTLVTDAPYVHPPVPVAFTVTPKKGHH